MLPPDTRPPYETLTLSRSVLRGDVTVSGAKNSALRLLAASLLTTEKVTLTNYPARLLDAQVHVAMLEKLGKRCRLAGTNAIEIAQDGPLSSRLDWTGRSIRNTLLILGALAARTGAGAVPLPGGCAIGARAFDLHEMVLRALGAETWEENGMLHAAAPAGGLSGADIHLPIRSTGATENAILCGCLARGTTRVWNPHVRPEILDLIALLEKMGARITVFGQEHIEIHGVESLSAATHDVIPDNIEAVTWLAGAVMTKGEVTIRNFPYANLEVALIHLRESGARFARDGESLVVRGGACYPLEISTGPHPGINSDIQPILVAYAACARGESRVVDLRFPGRYGYAEEMAKMGLRFSIDGNMLRVMGAGGALHGARVRARDLRAGGALALCGLVAAGETVIGDAWQVARGYEDFDSKLASLGAAVHAA